MAPPLSVGYPSQLRPKNSQSVITTDRTLRRLQPIVKTSDARDLGAAQMLFDFGQHVVDVGFRLGHKVGRAQLAGLVDVRVLIQI